MHGKTERQDGHKEVLDSKRLKAMLDLREWKALLRGLGLIGVDLLEVDASLCFSWARMVVVDDTNAKGFFKETHLPFEGFLEGLCRVAVLKALPSDAEVEAAGCKDAAIFLEELEERDPEEFQQLLTDRRVPWGQESSLPRERCVAGLMALIVRKVELGAGGLDERHLAKWLPQQLASESRDTQVAGKSVKKS